MLIHTAYLPPISWYKTIYNAKQTILIDDTENYQKQTLRNRCHILTANGTLALTVPIEKGAQSLSKTQIKDIKISSHGNWQHQHWHALLSAYNDSPFWQYYEDDFHPYYFEKRWKYLLDYNMAINQTILELLNITPQLMLNSQHLISSTLIPTSTETKKTYLPTPQHTIPQEQTPYYQVFAHKHGFTPNLSIIDLLCNMGNEAILYIK